MVLSAVVGEYTRVPDAERSTGGTPAAMAGRLLIVGTAGPVTSSRSGSNGATISSPSRKNRRCPLAA